MLDRFEQRQQQVAVVGAQSEVRSLERTDQARESAKELARIARRREHLVQIRARGIGAVAGELGMTQDRLHQVRERVPDAFRQTAGERETAQRSRSLERGAEVPDPLSLRVEEELAQVRALELRPFPDGVGTQRESSGARRFAGVARQDHASRDPERRPLAAGFLSTRRIDVHEHEIGRARAALHRVPIELPCIPCALERPADDLRMRPIRTDPPHAPAPESSDHQGRDEAVAPAIPEPGAAVERDSSRAD